MFLTPVGKMDDTDKTHSQDIDVPKPQPKNKQPYPVKNYAKAAKSLFEEKCTIEEIKLKYTLSEAAKKTILDMVANLIDEQANNMNNPELDPSNK